MSDTQPTGDTADEGHDTEDEAHVPDAHGTSTAVEGAHGSTSDHGEDHGHDDHAHAAVALGGIDWPMWGAGILGVVLALIIAAAFVTSTGFSFSA